MKLFIKAFLFSFLFIKIVIGGCNPKTSNNNYHGNDATPQVTTTLSEAQDSFSHLLLMPGMPHNRNSEVMSSALGPEQSFINYTVTKNEEEIFRLKEVLDHAGLQEIKQYATVMVKDHNTLERDLKR